MGFTALLLVGAVTEAFDGQAFTAPPAPWAQPVLWLGGPIGVAFVVVAAFAVRGLGVLVFSLLTIVGPYWSAGCWWTWFAGARGHGSDLQTIVAVLLSMAATVLAFLGSRRPTGTMHR